MLDLLGFSFFALFHVLVKTSFQLGVKDRHVHHSQANWFEFPVQVESSCCICMPDTFGKNDIVRNNTTSSHLNDNFVLVYIFLCIQKAATEKKEQAFKWQKRSMLGQSSGSIQVCPI